MIWVDEIIEAIGFDERSGFLTVDGQALRWKA
jgi:hypothetical protein